MTYYDGEYAAPETTAPHQGGPLGMGSIEDGLLPGPLEDRKLPSDDSPLHPHWRRGPGRRASHHADLVLGTAVLAILGWALTIYARVTATDRALGSTGPSLLPAHHSRGWTPHCGSGRAGPIVTCRAAIDLVEGHAVFTSQHEVKVDGRTISAGRVVINTGGTPDQAADRRSRHRCRAKFTSPSDAV